jgi:hypothetical protein
MRQSPFIQLHGTIPRPNPNVLDVRGTSGPWSPNYPNEWRATLVHP